MRIDSRFQVSTHTPRLQGVSGLFESYIGVRVVPLILPIRNKPFPSTILSPSLSLEILLLFSYIEHLLFSRSLEDFFPPRKGFNRRRLI